VSERVLIIKLDALGDVLRTTCILPALRKKYPRAQVTWITMPEAAPLLGNNPYIDRVVAYGPDANAMLSVEYYDLVLCLDAALRSATLGSLAKSRYKKGFGLDKSGAVFPFNQEAEEWFLMGLFDDLKKKNTRTYQEIIMDICGFSGMDQEIVLYLTEEEKLFAREFARSVELPDERLRARNGVRVVGVNTGSGSRWPMKQWPVGHCVDFINECLKYGNRRVLLFGGREETERNKKILESVGGQLIDTGCGNSLREFAALIGLCDVLVASDTLGIHVALALGKKVVGLFGPTSAAEIDVYGRGVKIVSDVRCACCYLRKCTRSPSCMDRISPASVLRAVNALLGH